MYDMDALKKSAVALAKKYFEQGLVGKKKNWYGIGEYWKNGEFLAEVTIGPFSSYDECDSEMGKRMKKFNPRPSNIRIVSRIE